MARRRTHTRRTPRSNPVGTISVHPDGHGFVVTAEGDFFVPASKMNGAFDGDSVEVAPLPYKGNSPTARVVRVLDRAYQSIIGRYEVAEPFGVVVPEDPHLHHDVFTMRADNPNIPDGALVRVRLVNFPSRGTAATGVIEEVIAEQEHGSVLVDLLVERHKLETRFSDASQEQARAATLDVPAALAQGYVDLRERVVFTIDPADAKDFDDAVSLEPAADLRLSDGSPAPSAAAWRLGVHIADVSAYVPWDSAIDLDARRRATSTYLVDRVIPMLPEELSNDLCSLRPEQDRLSMTADLYLDAGANLVGADLYPAVIRSCARLTYGQVQQVLDWQSARPAAREGEGETPAGLSPHEAPELAGNPAAAEPVARRVAQLSRLAKRRAAMRTRKGGIDFNNPEARVTLDEQGVPTGIELRRKTDATELIEEAMILANEAVAEHLSRLSFPCAYRVHEKPALDSLVSLAATLEEFPWFNLDLEGRFVTGDPFAIQEVLELAQDRPEQELVSSLVLRSMKRALYRPDCDGHFGLASAAYCHFTSPIRRYPDLVVHRMLKAQIAGRQGRKVPGFRQQADSLRWICEHSSEMERVAEKAARESQECKMAEYLQQFVGQSFSGVVSGVATYGVYVRLENTAEGLVPIRSLGSEYFSLDAAHHCLVGQESGTMYYLGQRLPVTLVAADPRTRNIDFKITQGRQL
ncbi:MAG: RNB domain-containing ribonuclease [Coriobacteriia bacterium]|nr:RNB domain-containing ribonuclease [Coriobacteriia bacterium]